MARRSVLFSPGDDRSKLEGGLASAADVAIFDLEDGVAPDDKPAAREVVVAVLAEAEAAGEVCVRINAIGAGGREDLAALSALEAGPDGLVLPKVDGPAAVREAADLAADVGLAPAIWSLIETPDGVLNVEEIARAPPTTALIFGGEDYAAGVGAERTAEGFELIVARQLVVMAAASAGIDAIDGITPALDDLEAVRRDARQARAFGFDGKLAIHPAQVEPIHAAFAPDPEQVAWAERVLAAVGEADRGVVRVDDEMIDAPLIERARQIIDRADADR